MSGFFSGGFFARVVAIFLKELVQMRRDKLTFGMMFAIPILQLILFGYAINNDPKGLPTAVHIEDSSPIVRGILKSMEVSDYYDFILETSDPRESADLLAKGDVAFVVSIPAGFTRKLIRGERPQILIEADASDPAASSNAIGNFSSILNNALRHELRGPLAYLQATAAPVETIIHPLYNPEGITQYNIVPGLLGVILTMTLIMITGMAMTREAERGNLENLLAMPAQPFEVMVGKITPYIFVGAIQSIVVLVAAKYLFSVPFIGSLSLLFIGLSIFMLANLAIGFTFSTIAKSQMQAMQLTFFFFLPSLLLSGFMFPFRGMPSWAQTIGEILPLTHFLRVVRGVMLKGTDFSEIQNPIYAMSAFTLLAVVIAMVRYKTTLD